MDIQKMKSSTSKDQIEEFSRNNAENTILNVLQEISNRMESVNLKLHNRYTEEDLSEVQKKIQDYLRIADEKYEELNLAAAKHPNEDKYEKISNLHDEIKKQFKDKEITGLRGEDKANYESMFEQLFTSYSELTYSFQTASKETKDIQENTPADNIGMILLCKNVRIMEDLINKICSNNIDKSIIGGDKHFDSMRYGFEWLFCHNDIGRSASYKRIDIRDRNRYLDYIKYQIMVSSKYAAHSPKSSTDIDKVYLQIQAAFDKKAFEEKAKRIQKFKEDVTKLIGDFFSVYELLTKYRDTLFHEEEIRKELGKTADTGNPIPNNININIINLSSVAVRVLLDRFVSFVKISDLNFGNSTFNCSWFNYSELSNSNYAGSNFKNARLENAKVKECDISTCNLSLADGGYTDFSYSNFNYSDLTGMNLADAIVNYCEFQNAIFRDRNLDSYQDAIRYSWGDEIKTDERAGKLIDIWSSTCYSNYLPEQIIDVYKEIELPDLNIDEMEHPWSILKCDLTQEQRTKLTSTMRGIIKSLLGKHISAELLSLVKERFSWEKPGDRIKEYGKVVLETAYLTGLSAKFALLSGSDLCHITMHNSSFENADLSGSIMHYTNAKCASFIFSNINHAECFESDYYSSNFSNAVMNDALFLNCNLNHTNFQKAILIGSVFVDLSNYVEPTINQENIDMVHLKMNDCFEWSPDPKHQRMISDCRKEYTIPSKEPNHFWQFDCNINDASFQEVLADNSVFLNISADRSSFNGASFRNAFFANCRMYLSDFITADFRYASMMLCCMGQSNFTNANMTSSIIRYVDFTNSNLTNALLNLSEINHVLFENSGLESLNFSGAQVYNSAFINCKLEKIVMSEAKFVNCIFSHIEFGDLIGAHSATIDNCYFDNCTYNGVGRRDGILTKEEFLDSAME